MSWLMNREAETQALLQFQQQIENLAANRHVQRRVASSAIRMRGLRASARAMRRVVFGRRRMHVDRFPSPAGRGPPLSVIPQTRVSIALPVAIRLTTRGSPTICFTVMRGFSERKRILEDQPNVLMHRRSARLSRARTSMLSPGFGR